MDATTPPSGHRRWRRLAGGVVGLALLGLAVGYAARGVDLAVIGRAPWWVFVGLAGLVGVNLLLTAGLFWSVTRSFAAQPRVKLSTMTALLAVSGVLNFIPVVRAGLWGRAAYLKRFHGLAVRDSVLTLGVVLGLAVAVLGTVALVLLMLPGEVGWWACGGALAVQTVLGPRVWGRALRRPAEGFERDDATQSGSGATPCRFGQGVASFFNAPAHLGSEPPRCGTRYGSIENALAGAWMWVPLRTLDLAAAAGRLCLAFGVVGVELSWSDAALLASANLIVKLVGLTPNGLGLSEWVIAALSAAMMPIETATAAAAALVDRTVEVLVVLPAGAAGAWWLKRELKKPASAEAHAG